MKQGLSGLTVPPTWQATSPQHPPHSPILSAPSLLAVWPEGNSLSSLLYNPLSGCNQTLSSPRISSQISPDRKKNFFPITDSKIQPRTTLPLQNPSLRRWNGMEHGVMRSLWGVLFHLSPSIWEIWGLWKSQRAGWFPWTAQLHVNQFPPGLLKWVTAKQSWDFSYEANSIFCSREEQSFQRTHFAWHLCTFQPPPPHRHFWKGIPCPVHFEPILTGHWMVISL